MNLAIRVSRSYEEVAAWVQGLKGDKVIVYQHDADDEVSRTHIHMLIINSGLKPDAMKARFKTLYGEIVKTDWSFSSGFKEDGKVTPISEDTSSKFITYMSKGHLTPVYNHGYDPVDLLRLTQEWKEPKKMLSVKGGKFVRTTEDVPEKPKKTRRTLVEVMVDRGKDQDIGDWDTKGILMMIRQVLVENNEVVGMWKVMEYYDAYMMYACKDAWLNMIVKKIESRNSK